MGQCIVRGKVAEMANLKVLAGRQNMGIGTAMIRALISFARLAGASVTEIGVSTDNKRAFNLYSRLGFNQDRTLRIREAEPAIILRKSI
jgi:ribosomal protein S18 acetylase RimI-like enzyme